MSLSENNSGMVMPVGPMYGQGGYGFDGGFGGGLFWIIILFLFAFVGNGWGGFGQNCANSTGAEVQRGFDQQAIMNNFGSISAGLNSIAQANCQSFANAELAASNRQMANMQQMFDLSTQFANCCCENRLATANMGAQIASTSQASTQAILDKLCQMEMDGMKRDYENTISGMQNQIDNLRSQVTNQAFAASQTAQTAQVLADNAAQTVALEQYLNPTPIPAYAVQRPCCGNAYGM